MTRMDQYKIMSFLFIATFMNEYMLPKYTYIYIHTLNAGIQNALKIFI